MERVEVQGNKETKRKPRSRCGDDNPEQRDAIRPNGRVGRSARSQSMTQAYAIRGRKTASQPYQYTQCGLDDVYILNGYKRRQTPYGSGITVENVEGLHEAIAQHLCLNKACL